jgi:microcystin-dependent protein
MIVAGSGILWFIATPPTHFLIADGTAISRTTYSVLFAILGTTYGVGDGSTTFNLPDFKGRTPIGSGQGSGLTLRSLADKVGVEVHALIEAEMPSHPGHNSTSKNAASGGAPTAVAQLDNLSKGSGTAHQNMQPSLCVNVAIAYENVADEPPEAVVVSLESGQFSDFLDALTVAP